MSYVRKTGGRLAALIGLFGLGLSAALAQLLPPDDYFKWSGAGGNGLWSTGTNWIGGPSGNGGVPTINADVLFADEPTLVDTYAGLGYGYASPLTVDTNSTGRLVNSLWFETGREYTIEAPWDIKKGRAGPHNARRCLGSQRRSHHHQSQHRLG